MSSLAALMVVASTVLGQSEGEKAFKSYADLVVGGTWTTTVDGQHFGDTYQRILDGRFVQMKSKGAAGFPAGVTILGVDPATKNFTWWGFDADGMVAKGTSKLVGDGVWDGMLNSKGPKGSVSSKGRLTTVDADTIKYEVLDEQVTGNAKPFSKVSIWRRRAKPQAQQAHEQWIEYLAGKWNVTGSDGNKTVEVLELCSGGKALLSRGKLADGDEYVRVVGWHADTKTVVETWYTASGLHLVNRYGEIAERKMAGQTTFANGEGQAAKGMVVREIVGENEFKTTYEGTLPGQQDRVEMTWSSKRVPHSQLQEIAGIVGKWKMEGQWKDGTIFKGEESTQWCLGNYFLRSSGWFNNHDGHRVDYQIMTGWDPESKKILEWFWTSDGSHSKRFGNWHAESRIWASKESGVDGDGKPFSFDVEMTMVDQNNWTWKGTNFKGAEALPELDFKFTRMK